MGWKIKLLVIALIVLGSLYFVSASPFGYDDSQVESSFGYDDIEKTTIINYSTIETNSSLYWGDYFYSDWDLSLFATENYVGIQIASEPNKALTDF